MRILDIVPGTSVDGPGLRTSVYFAGCAHHCPGCHNPQSWDMTGGREMSVDQVMAIVDDNGFNVTLSGGDPLYQPDDTAELCLRLRENGYTIWLYSGYTYEEIASDPKLRRLMPLIDVLVDGPYIAALRDTSLHFRGSSNQRLLDMPATLSAGQPVIFMPS